MAQCIGAEKETSTTRLHNYKSFPIQRCQSRFYIFKRLILNGLTLLMILLSQSVPFRSKMDKQKKTKTSNFFRLSPWRAKCELH